MCILMEIVKTTLYTGISGNEQLSIEVRYFYKKIKDDRYL